MIAGKLPEMQPITVDALRMARALSLSDDMVLDYIDKNILVMVNKTGSFRYVISGKSRPE